jgi:hypothetical protein
MTLFVSVEDKEGDSLTGVFEIQRIPRHFPGQMDSICLRFISMSEDSAFNQAQLPYLVSELQSLEASLQKKDEQEELAKVLAACKRITGKSGASIHFYADGGSES